MLVRYRTNSSCTLANFRTDINNIILGNVASVNDLSSGADKTNSVVYGSYPTSKYTRVNGTTYTYSKIHNDSTTSKTHYFRLTFDATQLTTINLAQSYTSGTDTLVNSYAKTVNISPASYESYYKSGIDIIVSSKIFAIFAPNSGNLSAIVDLGHSSTTRTYTDSMLMMFQDFSNVPNYGTNTGSVIPYIYNYDIPGYGNITTSIQGTQTIRKAVGSTSVVFENPAFVSGSGAGNLMYGCYRIPFNCFAGIQVYKDSSNLYRLTVNDISLLVD
jgi:hypothetical protein